MNKIHLVIKPRLVLLFLLLISSLPLLQTSCNSNKIDSTRIDGYLERADMYYRVGDFENYQKAEEQYRYARNLDPKNTKALTRLGAIYYIKYEYYYARKDLESAKKHWNYSYNCLNEALKYKTDDPEIYSGIARLDFCIKKYDEGIKLLQKIFTLPSVDIIIKANTHKELGRFYNQQQKYPDALREFKEYLHLLPETEDADTYKRVIKELEKELAPLPQEKK